SADLVANLNIYRPELLPGNGAWPIYQRAADAQMRGDHRTAAELVRQAATRPAIGYIDPPINSNSYYPSSEDGDFFNATLQHWPSGNFNAAVIEPVFELEFE